MTHVHTRLVALLAAAVATAALLVAPPTATAADPGTGRCRAEATSARACGSVLTVTVSGAGVVTAPPDISCRELPPPRPHRRVPGACTSVYGGGPVVLTATPDAGHRLQGWTGCDSQDGNLCTVTMTADHTVTATFVPDLRVVGVQVEGSGTVTSDPGGIECRVSMPGRGRKNPCLGDFPAGSQVTLTAAPDAGQQFTGWSVPVRLRTNGRATPAPICAGTAPTCTFTMPSGDVEVRATFGPATVAPYLLRVGTAGAGTGTVTTSPGGTCDSLCWYPFDDGTTVTLTAVPAAGSTFGGFSGAPCSASPCTVTMTQSRYVTARFDVADAPDTTPPDTRITSGPRNPANDHSPFRFRSSEAGATFQCSLDGGPREACVSGIDYTCLAPGRHTFRVWATDPAGNTDPTPAARRFRVRDSGHC